MGLAGGEAETAAAADLFCGAGGLSRGLQQAGIRICAGIDADPSYRYPFEANVARMIGNAVPAGPGRAIGACIAGHLARHVG